MIPFALVHGDLCFKNSKSLEIQVHELSDEHILTRLPAGYMEMSGPPESMVLYFYDHELKKYEKTEISSKNFTVKKVDGDRYSDSFEIRINNTDFSEYARILSKQYLEYIDLKLYEEDHVMSHAMMGGRYPDNKEDIYRTDLKEAELQWIKSFYEETGSALEGKRIYFSLEDPLRMKGFLKRENIDFPDEIRSISDGIVIGNSFCTNLFPSFEQFGSLVDKAVSHGLKIMISVPPVSESELEKFCRLISEMIGYLHLRKTEGCVFQFGDEGMLFFAKEHFSGDPVCSFEKGILLNKRKRDPRRRYLADSSDKLKTETENLMFSEKTVFMPYFQTNTGTFCPLHALITTGSRSRQTRVSDCEKYCEKYYLRYPDHLMMKGKGNSLFGFCSAFLNDNSLAEHDGWKSCERVVINI